MSECVCAPARVSAFRTCQIQVVRLEVECVCECVCECVFRVHVVSSPCPTWWQFPELKMVQNVILKVRHVETRTILELSQSKGLVKAGIM